MATLKPLTIGSLAPDFDGIDQYGHNFNLKTSLEQSSVVLIFYRGSWCPVCKRYLSNFQDELSSLLSAGLQVIAVAPEVEKYRDETIENTGLEFPVILDDDNSIMIAYGVAFDVTQEYQNKIEQFKNIGIAEANEQDQAVLPVPATYIIGQDGTIQWVHFDINYKNRASVEEILENFK
jgi:peroxiredoxin